MLRPRLLIMDEPTSGVSTEEKHDLMEVLMDALEEQKTTSIFVEHDVDIVNAMPAALRHGSRSRGCGWRSRYGPG